jgi:hypothetical protein
VPAETDNHDLFMNNQDEYFPSSPFHCHHQARNFPPHVCNAGLHLNRVSSLFVNIHPPGNHIQICGDPVQCGEALAFIVPVAHLDFSQVIPKQTGHPANRRAFAGERGVFIIIHADLDDTTASHVFLSDRGQGAAPLQGPLSLRSA